MTVKSLIWSQLFKLSENFLEVILLGSSGWNFWCDANGVNRGVEFHRSFVGLGWERVLRELVLELPLRWTELYVGRGVVIGVRLGIF